MIDQAQLERLHEISLGRLLEACNGDGIWEGRLSSSPLATAVSVFALHAADPAANREFADKGLRWLAEYQHDDGGWGDAEKLDPANLSSTLLCYAALRLAPDLFADALQKAERWITHRSGSMEPHNLANAIYEAYGQDRTFAVPILTMCALTGLLGPDGWPFVKPLPFELAVLPRSLFRLLKLTVVSYALPALIAIGQAKYHFDPPSNPVARLCRRPAVTKTLQLLTRIQPSNGGFLEAAPLTAFVVMSLASIGQGKHIVVQRGVEFLRQVMRSDGSWPIDTNLSTWCTSLAINAVLRDTPESLPEDRRRRLAEGYVRQQFKDVHSFTGAAPGGWGWTSRPGSVPDADDTAGALVALHRLGICDAKVLASVRQGLIWLLNLQNTDGGIPTFCKGWGRLEFDRSCPDITAHAISAWQLWKPRFDDKLGRRMEKAVCKALKYLAAHQQSDGSWLPLWFGNPFLKDGRNPVYGTARVLQGLRDIQEQSAVYEMARKGLEFLAENQNADFGWGSKKGAVSTIEETSLVVDTLRLYKAANMIVREEFLLESGLVWICSHIEGAASQPPFPLGLYFAKLWYAEKFYPLLLDHLAIKGLFLAEKCDCVRKVVN